MITEILFRYYETVDSRVSVWITMSYTNTARFCLNTTLVPTLSPVRREFAEGWYSHEFHVDGLSGSVSRSRILVSLALSGDFVSKERPR